eukprot:366525-Chlamydomonas_euryale.AAC.19
MAFEDAWEEGKARMRPFVRGAPAPTPAHPAATVTVVFLFLDATTRLLSCSLRPSLPPSPPPLHQFSPSFLWAISCLALA